MSAIAVAIINNDNKPVLVRSRLQDQQQQQSDNKKTISCSNIDDESHNEGDINARATEIHIRLFSALDAIEEKQGTREPFLGILCQTDRYKVYGLCSVSQTKVLLMVEASSVRDNEARSMLRTIHNAYVNVTAGNPFYSYGTEVQSSECPHTELTLGRIEQHQEAAAGDYLFSQSGPNTNRRQAAQSSANSLVGSERHLLPHPHSFRVSAGTQQLNTTDTQRTSGVQGYKGGRGDPSRLHSTSYGQNSGSLSPSSRRWNPPSYVRRDAHVNPQIYEKNIDFKVRGILNKITPEKFDKLSRELLDLGLESHDVLKRVLLLIFNKALDDSKYSCMYAKLCKVIYDNLSRSYDGEHNSKDIFKILLLSKCKEEFENRRNAFEIFESKREPLSFDDEELRSIAKQKMLGNIKFICELGKQELLPQNILHECIKQLLSKKKTQSFKDKVQDLECLCEIMRNIGYLLDTEEARGFVDQYFERMDNFSKNPELNSRIRFMLLDVIDLRKDNWVPRQKEAIPSIITDPNNEYRDDVLLSQYGFPFIRHNVNMKSPRMDDVFSQINLGPYYLGTGPGAINDVSHLPNMNNFNQRRSNQFGNFSKNQFVNYPNPNGGIQSNRVEPKRDRERDRESSRPTFPQPSSVPSGILPNGINSLNRDMVNLPPRFQKQMKQNHPSPFPQFKTVEPVDNGRQPGKVPFENKNTIAKPSAQLNFPKPLVPLSKPLYPLNTRNNLNDKETTTNFVERELNQLKIQESSPAEPETNVTVVNVFTQVEKILGEYFQSDNVDECIQGLKNVNTNFDEMLLTIIRISIGKSETEREQAFKLIKNMKVNTFVAESAFLASLKNLFCKMPELEVETPRARSYVAAFIAHLVVEGALSLKEVGDLLDGGQHYPLFPLVLQNLHKAKGQDWLFDSFTDSKINLIGMLPENDRNKERMADILEDRNLTFLYPMLRIESDITKQITLPECTPATLYRWLKDNVSVSLQSNPEFITVVFTTLLKHIVAKHNNPEKANVFNSAIFASQEKELAKYQQVLKVFLTGKQDLQLVVLYSLQTFCHEINFPKGLLEKWFNMLYEFEIVDEEVFLKWKEDINDEYPGKGKALFQVNKWLTWLEETEEDEDE